jgi:hypothetical protein
VTEKICFIDLTDQPRAASGFLGYFNVGDAQISRIADRIAPLRPQYRVQPVCEAEVDEVVEAPSSGPIVANGIEALDYIRAPFWPSVGSLLTKAAARRQRAEMQQEILFEVKHRILAEPPVESPCHPAAYPQRIPLEELTKILRDNEAIFAHVMAVWVNGE